MDDPKVFAQKYESALADILAMDYAPSMARLGASKHDQGFVFDFFNRKIAFDGHDFVDLAGDEVFPAVKVVLCNYILKSPSQTPILSEKMVTFREFSNAGPLFSRFSENTGHIISTHFSGRMDKLTSRCLSLGADLLDGTSYDVSAEFPALSHVSIRLNVNDADDLMPAGSVFLFHDDAESWLDLESLAILCTYLTGLLIQGRS
jgi:hypothetical protein